MNPRKAADLEIRVVGDEVLVHQPATQKVHVLNRTAGQILELCDGLRTTGDIAAAICHDTGADRDTVERDVDALIAEFTKLKLVTF